MAAPWCRRRKVSRSTLVSFAKVVTTVRVEKLREAYESPDTKLVVAARRASSDNRAREGIPLSGRSMAGPPASAQALAVCVATSTGSDARQRVCPPAAKTRSHEVVVSARGPDGADSDTMATRP